ncbi:MAG: hypothetical protein ACOYI8_01900 [Christensenellales bacterium]
MKKTLLCAILCLLVPCIALCESVGIAFPKGAFFDDAAKHIAEILQADGIESAIAPLETLLTEGDCAVILLHANAVPEGAPADAYIAAFLCAPEGADCAIQLDAYLTGAAQASAMLEHLSQTDIEMPYKVALSYADDSRDSHMRFLGARDVLQPYINKENVVYAWETDDAPDMMLTDEAGLVSLYIRNSEMLCQSAADALKALLRGETPPYNDQTEYGAPAWILEPSLEELPALFGDATEEQEN